MERGAQVRGQVRAQSAAERIAERMQRVGLPPAGRHVTPLNAGFFRLEHARTVTVAKKRAKKRAKVRGK